MRFQFLPVMQSVQKVKQNKSYTSDNRFHMK